VNIKEYINSGILESYVLGLATEQERFEFEQLCRQYPELAEARSNFEKALEKLAMDSSVSPPAGYKEKIWSAIREAESPDTPKIIPMDSTETRRVSGIRWVAAASIILFLGAGYFAFKFYNENAELKTELKNTKDIQARLDQQLKKLETEQEMMKSPDAIVVNLVGTEKKSSANVYWDSASSNVYLVVKNMPVLASDKQYQLWALIDGKPADLGLFDGGSEKVILKMKNTRKADAFAITIENRGNTGGPNLDRLQSMEKTKL
jgi:anti-sigma-K factor RskA